MMRVLDLFSGIGGFSLGLERTGGFETVAFCEIEDFPRRVLAKHWPNVPIHRDVRKLTGGDVGPVDVICGGYPCQPFSTAGKRRGKEDDRHLWPEFSRLVAELRPSWVIGENVAGHVSMGLDDVLSDLERQGYACRTFVVPACAVGAIHRRDRTWVVANAISERPDTGASREVINIGVCDELGHRARADGGRQDKQPRSAGHGPTPYALGLGQSGSGRTTQPRNSQAHGDWEADQPFHALERPDEPPVRGADDGVSRGLDESRLAALGNAVVPQIPYSIGRAILAAEMEAAA
jgi:DNA (cytosine-5)-methyltransferase 1